MTPAKVVHTGALSLPVRIYADGRFGWDEHRKGARVKIRLQTLAAATERAKQQLEHGTAGTLNEKQIDREQYAAFLRYQAERARVSPVPVVVAAFLAAKENKGRSFHHLRRLRRDVEAFASAFPGAIGEVNRAQVEQWLDGRKVGPRRWNNLREALVGLWRFARREGVLGAQLCGAELVERKRVEFRVETYTPDELAKILAIVPREWLPAIVLGAFCGLRPQEICPEPRSRKLGLTWGDILWSKGKVHVPAAVSKTRHPRFAPLTDAALAFLWDRQGEPKDEPVCPRAQLNKRTAAWGRLSGVGWRNDALRHSFASYRLALKPDLPALALEMGNSPAMIQRHYLELQHEDEAAEWFALRPKLKHPIRIQNETFANRAIRQ